MSLNPVTLLSHENKKLEKEKAQFLIRCYNNAFYLMRLALKRACCVPIT